MADDRAPLLFGLAVQGDPVQAVEECTITVAQAALSGVRLGAAPDGSILSLFKPTASQKTQSNRDEAFLRGLYRLTLDRRAEQHQRTLVGQMVRETAAN